VDIWLDIIESWFDSLEDQQICHLGDFIKSALNSAYLILQVQLSELMLQIN